MTFQPPRPQAVSIPGPVGSLQAILEEPAGSTGVRVAVVCHPHPLHGGTMTNKVVHTLARTFNELGLPAVRFNYRGVGSSSGQYDDGLGETEDALAVIDWMLARWPEAQLWLAGFSFGGGVAFRAATKRRVERLVTVAPAVAKLQPHIDLPDCPWLIVQGDRDDLVDVGAVREWAAAMPRRPELVVLEGAEHYFHGRLQELRAVVADWAGKQPEKPAA